MRILPQSQSLMGAHLITYVDNVLYALIKVKSWTLQETGIIEFERFFGI
jgi:hypothetical protein